MKNNLFILLMLLFTQNLYSQWSIGIGTQYAWNRMVNVDPNELRPYGHSGKQTNQRSNHGLQPLIFVHKDIGRHFDIEFGVGYSIASHSWDFNYFHTWYRWSIDTTVTFTDQWLTLPVSVGYHYSFRNHDRLRAGLGIRTQVLLKGEDNYMKTVFETIEIVAPHNSIAFCPELTLSYQKHISDKFNIQLGLFGKINPFVISDVKWGFYGNIYPARQLQYGIFLKTKYKISK